MTRYISIDIDKARPWIFYIMVSQENLEFDMVLQENLEMYPFWEKTGSLKCT